MAGWLVALNGGVNMDSLEYLQDSPFILASASMRPGQLSSPRNRSAHLCALSRLSVPMPKAGAANVGVKRGSNKSHEKKRPYTLGHTDFR